jgi:hypothetical protein
MRGFPPSGHFRSATLPEPTYDASRRLTLTAVNRGFAMQERARNQYATSGGNDEMRGIRLVWQRARTIQNAQARGGCSRIKAAHRLGVLVGRKPPLAGVRSPGCTARRCGGSSWVPRQNGPRSGSTPEKDGYRSGWKNEGPTLLRIVRCRGEVARSAWERSSQFRDQGSFAVLDGRTAERLRANSQMIRFPETAIRGLVRLRVPSESGSAARGLGRYCGRGDRLAGFLGRA